MLHRCVLVTAALLGGPAPELARAQPTRAEPASSDPLRPDDPPIDVENEKAMQTFKEGIAAFDRRDFEAARVAFLQTFALKPTAPVVRRNLGLAEIYSGHYLEGARRLGRVIHTTDEGTALDRARMVESLKKAEAHLERVTVEVNVEGAQIRVDDVDLGVSPLPFAWYLEPGSYEVRVSKPGFLPYSETRLARAGSAQHLRIHLTPASPLEEVVPAPPPAAPAPAPVPPADIDRGPNPWLLVAGSTLTAGGLVAGITLTLFAADNSDKADRLRDQIGAPCRAPMTPQCIQLGDAVAAHDRQMRWATVSFALGAAAGVSTAVYALLAGRNGSTSTSGAGPRSLGVSLAEGRPTLVVDGAF